MLFDPGLATEHQCLAAATAQVTPALLDQVVTLGAEGEIAVGAWAAVDVARCGASLDRVGVATVRWQLVNPAHDQLPFLAMGRDAVAKQLVGNQVCHFVGDSLLEKIFAVFAVQLRIEAQQVLMQVGNSGLLAAQLEADYRALERPLKKHFGLFETVFDAGVE